MDQTVATKHAIVQEGQSYPLAAALPEQEDASSTTESSLFLRTFELSLRGVTAHVCTLGASLTQLHVPSSPTRAEKGNSSSSSSSSRHDDVVLGYKTPVEMYQSGNPTFMCAVVGRVANRIAKGCLQLESNDNGQEIQLAINNEVYPQTDKCESGRTFFLRRIIPCSNDTRLMSFAFSSCSVAFCGAK